MLKGALINARSIAYVGQGATAVIMRSILEKLGITEAMNAKTKLVGQCRARRRGEEGGARFTQISEILNVLVPCWGPARPVEVCTTVPGGDERGHGSPAALPSSSPDGAVGGRRDQD